MTPANPPHPTTVACPQCGTPVNRGSRPLCPQCGFPFDWAEKPTQDDEATVAAMTRRPREDTAEPAPAPTEHPLPPPPPPELEEGPVGEVACPACQTPNPEGRTYCQRCGSRLWVPRPVPAPPVATPRPRSGVLRRTIRPLTGVLLAAALAGAAPWVRSWLTSSPQPQATTTTVTTRAPVLRQVDPASIQASASSTRPDEPRRQLTYEIRNTLDGQLATAWNSHGDVRGPEVGETLTFRFRTPVRLARIEVVNGYAKSRSVFAQNGRVRQAVVRTDGAEIPVSLRDTRARTPLSGSFGVTSSVTIVVRSVYPGSTYPDLALTEIAFFGTPPR